MNFLDRRNKIQILQERANVYNNLQDQLYDSNMEEQAQQKIIQTNLDTFTQQQLQQVDQKRFNPNLTLSSNMAKSPVSVLTTSALISLGLDQYPKMTTTQQDFNSHQLQKYQQYREKKKNGEALSDIEAQRKANEEEKQRQTILFKADHLKDFEDATHQGFNKHSSQYRQEFCLMIEISEATAEYVRNQQKRNNLQKNDLNQFFEVYLKHKSTLRK